VVCSVGRVVSCTVVRLGKGSMAGSPGLSNQAEATDTKQQDQTGRRREEEEDAGDWPHVVIALDKHEALRHFR
jgi:hypothetical protein